MDSRFRNARGMYESNSVAYCWVGRTTSLEFCDVASLFLFIDKNNAMFHTMNSIWSFMPIGFSLEFMFAIARKSVEYMQSLKVLILLLNGIAVQWGFRILHCIAFFYFQTHHSGNHLRIQNFAIGI